MAAPKQNLYVPLGTGLQTDVDDKLLPLGKALELENCHPSRTGEMVRRFGGAQSIAPNTPFALANHKGALVSLGASGAASLSALTSASGPWGPTPTGDRRGPITPSLTKVAGSALAGQVAYGGGYYWVIWQDAGTISPITSLHYAALDVATGHVANSGNLSLSGGTSFTGWRAAFANGRGVFVASQNNSSTQTVAINPSSSFATTIGTVATVGPNGGGYQPWLLSVQTSGTVVQVAAVDNASNALAFDFDPVAITSTIWTPHNSVDLAIAISGGVCWVQDLGGSGKRALFTGGAVDGLLAQWDMPGSGATRRANFTYAMDPGATTAGLFIGGHTSSNASDGQLVAVYGLSIATGVSVATRQTGGATDFGSYWLGLRLASNTWTFGGDFFVAVRFDDQIDGTHYVVRVPGQWGPPSILAPLAPFAVRTSTAVGLGGFTPPQPSSVASPSAGVFTTAITYQPRLETGTFANAKDRLGVELATLTHGATPNTSVGTTREAVDSLLVPHGFLGAYDGQTYCEAGFAYPGQPPTSITSSAGGSLTAASDYFYVITFARMDAQGRVWRSAPSLVQKGSTAGGQGTLTLHNVPYLHLAGFTGGKVEFWRGFAGISTFFQKAGEQANSLTAATFNFVDTLADTDLAKNEDYPFNGGVLANDTPPVFSAIGLADGRVWGISADDPQALWFSKEFTLGQGLGFNEEFVLDVRDEHGAMTGLAAVDDKLVVFKRDAVNVVGGQGPNVLGQGNGYSVVPIGNGIGLVNPQSICEYKDGVAFRSTSFQAPFWMLDRGLSLQPIKEARRYAGVTITGAVFVSQMMQLRWYSSDGRTIVHDLATGYWSTYTGQSAACAVEWRRPSGAIPVYVVAGTNQAMIEDFANPVWQDAGSAYQMKAAGPWVQVNGIRGYERFYRLQPVGEARGVATLGTALYVNTDDTTAIATASKAFTSGVLDSELRYTAKFGAIKVVFTDNSPNNAGFALSGFSMVVAAKGGLRRAADAARMT